MSYRILQYTLKSFMGCKASNSCAHDAVFYNNPKALRLLKQNGCSLDKTDRLGFTPLHLACMLKKTKSTYA